MALKYPGARWYGIGGQGGYCSHRSCSWHEAVTTGGVEAIAGWVSSARACHGFTAKDGDAGQFADFDESVAGVLNGNGEVLTWENWDGLSVQTNRSPDGSFGPNDIGWTPEQFERNADIMAWMVDGLGIPLHMMQNTEEPGHGPHRLGVPQAGGNVQLNYGPTKWTSHPGKECPGDQRIREMPAMIARAGVILAAVRAGKCKWLPTGPVNLAAALARTGGVVPPDKNPADVEEEELMGALDEIKKLLEASEKRQAAKVDAAVAAINARVDLRTKDGSGSLIYGKYSQNDVIAAIGRGQKVNRPVDNTGALTTYTVKTGDTFGAIAAKLGVTADQLGAANPQVKDRNSIDVGQVLNAPKA